MRRNLVGRLRKEKERVEAARYAALLQIYKLATFALAEPPDGTETLVRICTICEEIGIG